MGPAMKAPVTPPATRPIVASGVIVQPMNARAREWFFSNHLDMNWTPSTWRFCIGLLRLHGRRSKQVVSPSTLKAMKHWSRRELIEIARFNGVSDPETLEDILL